MPYKLISPAAYQEFIQNLAQDQPAVAAPFWKEGKTSFELIGTKHPELGPLVGPTGYTPTLLPPKKYLYPAKEVLMSFSNGRITNAPFNDQPLILAGLRPCDINAIRKIDRIYLEDIEDPYYKARREKTLLLGWDCVEHCDEFCFCESVGGLLVEKGFDLFFTPLQGDYEDYVVNIGTDAGLDLVSRYAEVKDINDDMMNVYLQQHAEKLSNFPKRIKENLESVPLLMLGSHLSPLWYELKDLCFGCGACNIVCPTCSCFDVQDDMTVDLSGGQRTRCWDGCMLSDFAVVAGGHNFRPTRRERIRHRTFRKFKYQMQHYGEPYCTGCGRCARACLVDINPVDIINRLFELNFDRRRDRSKESSDVCPVEKLIK